MAIYTYLQIVIAYLKIIDLIHARMKFTSFSKVNNNRLQNLNICEE